MACLWHAGAPLKVAGNDVPLKNRHTLECLAQDARGKHPSHTPANHDLFNESLRTARALSVLPRGLYDLAHLTTQSMNHIADMELCLYLRLWVKSCGILQDKYRIRRVRHPIERTVMRETAIRAIVRLGAKSG
jgi:hypothetical protein